MKYLFFAITLLIGFYSSLCSAQSWVLSKRIGGSNNDYVSRTTFDKDGNMYAVGEFTSTISFDAIKLTSPTWSIYLVKYDPTGKALWAKIIGSAKDQQSDIYSRGLALDNDGNIFICGSFLMGATFSATSFDCQGFSDIFLTKLHSDGTQAWVKKAGGVGLGTFGQDVANAITTDAAGNCYITGLYNQDAMFDNIPLTSTAVSECFVAKYDPNGNVVWAKSADGGSSFPSASQGIGVDASSNVYIVGTFFATITIGDTKVDAGNAEQKMYIAKLNSDGSFLWAKRVGSGGYYGGSQDFVVDKDGNCYITGFYRADMQFASKSLVYNNGLNYSGFVVKYDKDGTELWAEAAVTDHNLRAERLTIDNQGNSYITGSFVGNATFGSSEITNTNEAINPFVAKLDAQGNFAWALPMSCNSAAAGNGISVSNDGHCIVAGTFQGILSIGSQNLASAGSQDVFLTKIQLNTSSVHEQESGQPAQPLFYPNPAKDQITINSAYTHLPLQVLSVSGIQEINSPEAHELNIKALPPGTYYVRVGSEQQKLIKLAN